MKPLAALILAALLLPLAGCTTLVVTRGTAPDGTPVVKVEYYSIGKDKSVEELTVPTSAGPATVRGGASNVNPAVNDVAATLRSLAERGVTP